MEPITREEIYMAAAAGEYEGELPRPVTREEKIQMAIYNRLGEMNISSSSESAGQTIEEYVREHPDFWSNIPDGTITRAKLADGVPEEIRDETLREIDADEVNQIFDSVFHNN